MVQPLHYLGIYALITDGPAHGVEFIVRARFHRASATMVNNPGALFGLFHRVFAYPHQCVNHVFEGVEVVIINHQFPYISGFYGIKDFNLLFFLVQY
jgi:hypothetical protein